VKFGPSAKRALLKISHRRTGTEEDEATPLCGHTAGKEVGKTSPAVKRKNPLARPNSQRARPGKWEGNQKKKLGKTTSIELQSHQARFNT